MMTHRRLVGPGLAFFLIMAAIPAMGDDLLPPDWRGLPNSTYQEWTFPDSVNPAPPVESDNPFGEAVATIYGEFSGPKKDTFWIAQDPYFGRQGIWAVGSSIGIEIPNDPTPRPQKKIRLQITYDGGLTVPEPVPWIEVVADNGAATVEFTLTQQVVLDAYYVHDTYDLVLEPNPSSETIWIYPYYCKIYVDQIVVDTLCVPEPSTLATLVLGMMALVYRGVFRRRREA